MTKNTAARANNVKNGGFPMSGDLPFVAILNVGADDETRPFCNFS